MQCIPLIRFNLTSTTNRMEDPVGSYSTLSRKLQEPVPVLKTRMSYDGLGTVLEYNDTTRVPVPTQTTYSFRTNEQGDLADSLDTATSRNGFTTYDPQYDTGHTFWSECQSYSYSAPEFYARYKYGSQHWWIRSRTVPYFAAGFPTYPGVDPLSANDVTVLGQRAINATAPTKPQATVAMFVGELKDLPTMIGADLLKSQSAHFRSLGGEYLNVQFGWLPFINDLKKMVQSLKGASQRILQLQRDNGRNVRRRFAFPSSVTTDLKNYKLQSSERLWTFGGSTGTFSECVADKEYDIFTRTQQRVWFSGCFTYAIPVEDSVLAKIARFEALSNVLLGTRLTPEVLWELTPWSWLIDWRVAIGTALSTATRLSDDGLVIRYAYLMAETSTTKYVTTPLFVQNLGDGVMSIPATMLALKTERKERFRATPYGFGLNTASFTDVQWAILAALGMTRSPRSLRIT